MPLHRRPSDSARRSTRLRLESLEDRRLLALVPELVADINTSMPDAGSNPGLLGVTKDRLYFLAQDGVHSNAFWSTDGTAAGTSLAFVADESTFLPLPSDFRFATGVENFYFLARRANNVHDLWVTHGSASEAARLATFNQPFYRMTAIGDQLYFSAPQSFNSLEPWVSDGTEAGTRIIKDVAGGVFSDSTPRYFTEFKGNIYFTANSLDANSHFTVDLWKTDGTAEGTQFVASNEEASDLDPRFLVASAGQLYFNGHDDATGRELWVSDGTAEGTRRVADLAVGPSDADPRYLTAANGLVYFAAKNENGVRDLWQSDGTAEGTRLVAESGHIVAAAERLLYFTMPGNELWRTDGTAEGTYEIRSLGAFPPGLRFTPRAGGVVYETVDSTRRDANVRELWWTDGESGHTEHLHTRTIPSLAGTTGVPFEILGNTIFFADKDTEHGTELWKLSPPPGDTNFDGLVDLADLNNVRNHFGETGSILGDSNGDGVVDLVDLNAVRNNFGVGNSAPDVKLPVARAVADRPARVAVRADKFDSQRNRASDLLFVPGRDPATLESSGKVAAKKLRAVDRVFAAY